MNELDESYQKLLGRQPSDEERQNLYKVRDALGLKNNDALWLVLMVLEHYKSQYEQLPAAIAKSASDTLQKFGSTADAIMKASAEKAKSDLAEKLASAESEIARNASKKEMWQWPATCIVVSFFLFASFGKYMNQNGHEAGEKIGGETGYKTGYGTGYVAGYKQAEDEKAAANWANTLEGNLAYRFSQTEDFASLVTCDRSGWYIQKGACYLKPQSKKTYGWALP